MIHSSAPGGEILIDCQSLWKIFGHNTRAALEAVTRRGATKADVLRDFNCVVGVSDVSLQLRRGEIFCIMGLSGSGKSTLIRLLNRLIDPSDGRVIVKGQDISTMDAARLRQVRARDIGMVFQSVALLPNRTVLENTGFGLEVQGIGKAERDRAALAALEKVGLSQWTDRYPSELSGGMQQRVGLARALANDAPILLMDEAYSALDPLIRYDMQTVLLDLQKEFRKTIIFITHDFDEALRIGDRIALLRDGSIVQEGTGQEMVLHPADDYVSSFVQHVDRAKVVRVASVMQPVTADAQGPAIHGQANLGEAIRMMSAQGLDRLTVLDQTGRAIGLMPMTRAVAVAAGAS